MGIGGRVEEDGCEREGTKWEKREEWKKMGVRGKEQSGNRGKSGRRWV